MLTLEFAGKQEICSVFVLFVILQLESLSKVCEGYQPAPFIKEKNHVGTIYHCEIWTLFGGD